MALAAASAVRKLPSPRLARRALVSPRAGRRSASTSPSPSPQMTRTVKMAAPTVAAMSTRQHANPPTLTVDGFAIEKCPMTSDAPVMSLGDSAVDGTKRERGIKKDSVSMSGLKSFDEMPQPKGLPLIGTLWEYMKKDGLSFTKMFEVMQERATELGPVYKERIGPRTSVVISDPEEYQKVMMRDGKYPHRVEMEPTAYYRRKKGLHMGTVNSQGEEWYRARTVLSKKLLIPQEMAQYCAPMDEVAKDFIKRLESVRDSGSVVNALEDEVFKWALESIGTVLFEDRIGCFKDPPPLMAREFLENLKGFFDHMQPLMFDLPLYKLYPTNLWKEFEKYADRVMQAGQYFVDKKVEALKKQAAEGVKEGEREQKSSFLTYLLSQSSWSPEDVNSNAVELMMGAVETASNATLWLLYLLSKNPDAQDALYRQSVEVLGKAGEIDNDALTKLTYVKACLKEMFRLYPITFATSRFIQEDMEVGGYHVPAGSHMQANIYGMGRDPKFFPEPEKFRPERWMNNEGDRILAMVPSIAFGHGSRMCVGRRIAEQELYIMLTKMIQNFRVELAGDDVKPVLNTVMTPDRPIKLRFIPRT